MSVVEPLTTGAMLAQQLESCLTRAMYSLEQPKGVSLNEWQKMTDAILMYCWTQDWDDDVSMGGTNYHNLRPKQRTFALCVVAIGPMGDAVVFHNGSFAYGIKKPSAQFFEDLSQFPPKLIGCTQGWRARYETEVLPPISTEADDAAYGWGC